MRKYCPQVILENFFEPCLLYLLMEKPGYGYELGKKLKENCSCNVNIANLYRGLNKLAKEKNVIKRRTKSSIGPAKIVYEITPKGKLLLKSWIEGLQKQNEIILHLINNYKIQYDQHNK